MPKNIVICIDGTGNEFGETNSNVVKLYSTLVSDQRQLIYYHPGLGTMGAPNALTKLARWWTKMIGLAFGYGLSNILTDAYSFLMANFEEGDRVYLFGFSRGAYSVRALAAMLHMFGLIRRENEILIPYAIRTLKYRNKSTFKIAAQFKATFSIVCKPHFVGLWDTVSSVGWIYDPVTLPFTFANPDIRTGRHAVSIDERRCFFRQNLWSDQSSLAQDIRQVCFAGVHCDVGGGYTEQESGLSKIALQWMMDEADANDLLFDLGKRDRVLGVTDERYARPDPAGRMHESLKGLWWVLEAWPKPYKDTRTDPPVTKWRIPLGNRRFIAPGSMIHPSVYERMSLVPGYRPLNLPAAAAGARQGA